MSVGGRTITYVGPYDTQGNGAENRSVAVAAVDKMNYITGALNMLSRDVHLVSPSATRNQCGYPGKTVPLGGNNRLTLFRTYSWGGKARRVVSVLSMRASLFVWLLRNCTAGQDVFVYHSLGYARLVALAHRIRGFRLILEVEEVYADVTGRARDRRVEMTIFSRADAFIFPTETLGTFLNRDGRPYAVVHGTYASESRMPGRLPDGRIHVVYAGTFDPRKGGALAAAAAEFLDERYHVHVIGFGTAIQTEALQRQVAEVASRSSCRLTYDGMLSGEEYVSFLQGCHIGLSTQRPDAQFNLTSFPSKVLSYLANGLRVVSIRLPVLEQSDVGDLLYYYDEDSPRALAEAIMAVDLTGAYDSRLRIAELDRAFQADLERLLALRCNG